MLVLNQLAGFGARRRVAAGAATLGFVDSAVSIDVASITIPATSAVGDLAVLLINNGGLYNSTAPNTPSGWTSIYSGTSGEYGTRMCYKILTSGNPGSSVSMTSNVVSAGMVVFNLSSGAISTVTASTANHQETTANPSSQSVTASSGAPPLVVIGRADALDGTGFSVETPAMDGAATGTSASGTYRHDVYLAYKIYNSSPANHTLDMSDLGIVNFLASFYLEVT